MPDFCELFLLFLKVLVCESIVSQGLRSRVHYQKKEVSIHQFYWNSATWFRESTFRSSSWMDFYSVCCGCSQFADVVGGTLTFLVCYQRGETFFFSTRNIQTLCANYNEIHCTQSCSHEDELIQLRALCFCQLQVQYNVAQIVVTHSVFILVSRGAMETHFTAVNLTEYSHAPKRITIYCTHIPPQLMVGLPFTLLWIIMVPIKLIKLSQEPS